MSVTKAICHPEHDLEAIRSRNPDKLPFHTPKTSYTRKNISPTVSSSLEELNSNVNIDIITNMNMKKNITITCNIK